MIDRIVMVAGAAFALAIIAGPAMAAPVAAVPEPATMTLFGLGAAGAFIAKRFAGRK